MSGKIRITFECDDHTGVVAWAKGFLEEEGYVVERSQPLHAKETPKQFIERIGINEMKFNRRMKQSDLPENFQCERGPTGRLLWLRASRELEEFMQ